MTCPYSDAARCNFGPLSHQIIEWSLVKAEKMGRLGSEQRHLAEHIALLQIKGVSNSVSLATEPTEIFEFFLRELSDLPWHRPPGQVCGKEILAHSFRHSSDLFPFSEVQGLILDEMNGAPKY